MDESVERGGRAVQPHARRCPNGHDVPPWRSDCGVCGAVPTPARGTASPVEGALTPDRGRGGPSKLAWASLVVLGIAAIVLPFLREPVLLQDDFTTPEVLRTWPDDGSNLAYVDGEYRVTVTAAQGGAYAVRELPREVNEMSVAVDARVVSGRPVIAVDCVSEMVEVSETGVEETAYYTFVLDPAADRFFIADADGLIDQGSISGDVDGGIVASCQHDGSATHLRLQVGDGDAVEVTDSSGLGAFRATSLGAFAEQAGAEVAFDDLRVIEREA